jgi:hypothetical protein
LVQDSLYGFELWVLAAGYLALFLLAMEIGFKAGRRVDPHTLERVSMPILTIETAILGLLGLLLGFTTSMAVSRYEERKHLVLEEANALGTSYLRTQLLAPPHDKEMQALLCRYVDARLESIKAGEDLRRITAARNQTMRLQSEFWNKVSVFAVNDPHPVPASLLLQSINQAIDMEGARWMALYNIVPRSVMIANATVALLAASLVGYSFGLAGKRQPYSMAVLSISVTIVLAVIIDLDRPRSGFIRVSQQPMIDLRTQMADQHGSCPWADQYAPPKDPGRSLQ